MILQLFLTRAFLCADRGDVGIFIPIAILLFAFSYIFYTGLVKLKNEIVNYKEYLTLSLENKHDVQLYIDELKKTNKT